MKKPDLSSVSEGILNIELINRKKIVMEMLNMMI